MRLTMCAAALVALCGCAVVHKVELSTPTVSTNMANVTVQDNRLDTTLKLQTIAGSGGGFMLLESSPSITQALADRVKAGYRGGDGVLIGIERLEIFNKIGFMSPDDMSCGIESTVKVGSGPGSLVRTRMRNTENMSPVVTTMARVLISQCLDAHAKDINSIGNT